jgi:hypothetical protein
MVGVVPVFFRCSLVLFDPHNEPSSGNSADFCLSWHGWFREGRLCVLLWQKHLSNYLEVLAAGSWFAILFWDLSLITWPGGMGNLQRINQMNGIGCLESKWHATTGKNKWKHLELVSNLHNVVQATNQIGPLVRCWVRDHVSNAVCCGQFLALCLIKNDELWN